MADIDDLVKDFAEKAEKTSIPGFASPMLATLTEDYFDDADWVYERKLDGERVLAFKDKDEARLMSRNEKRLDKSYPELVQALERLSESFICDGEVVAFSGDVTDFQKLQGRMHVSSVEEAEKSDVDVFYYIFDVTYLDGYLLENLPLQSRKNILKNVFSFSDPIRFLSHREKEGIKYYSEACQKGWEGVIAKDARSRYKHSRTRDWLKFKCIKEQEFVVGGYTEPKGERIGFGSMLVGYYQGNELRYAGKVGTGWDEDSLRRLHDKMSVLEREKSPFADVAKDGGVHFIEPKLVCEVGFSEWTNQGKLRHPRFLGIRRDKDPEEVTREDDHAG